METPAWLVGNGGEKWRQINDVKETQLEVNQPQNNR